MKYTKGLICAVVLFICASFVLYQDPAFAAKKKVPDNPGIPNIPDMDKLMLEAQKEVSEEEKAQYDELPVEESSNDGYWWIKQPAGQKVSYVEELIKAFKLEDKKLSLDKIVKELDIVYNPIDNPLDIKMDKSVERMFNIVTKRMMAK